MNPPKPLHAFFQHLKSVFPECQVEYIEHDFARHIYAGLYNPHTKTEVRIQIEKGDLNGREPLSQIEILGIREQLEVHNDEAFES